MAFNFNRSARQMVMDFSQRGPDSQQRAAQQTTTPKVATVAPSVSTGTQLAQEVYRQRADADKQREAQKQQALAALKKGLMSETQYQSMMSNLQENVEGQTERAARETTESAYGQTNIGAVKAGVANVRQQGRELLVKGQRDIGVQRDERAAEVGRQEADIISRYETPRMDIPAAFDESQALTAMTGQAPVRSASYGEDPGVGNRRGYSYSDERGWYKGPKRVTKSTTVSIPKLSSFR